VRVRGQFVVGPGKSLTATYARVEHLGQVAHAGVEVLRLNFECTPALSTVTGTAILRETVKPDLAVDDKMTQFLTRYLAPSKDAAKQVLTEEVIRLANDFPTTHREKAEVSTPRLSGVARCEQVWPVCG
jgi:hypothetical protein